MDRKTVRERYPAVYQRVRSYMQAHGDKSVSPSELVRALGFMTREEVIRRVLDGAEWASEENGRYVWTESAGDDLPARDASGSRDAPGSRAVEPESDDALARRLKRVLERESARNRIGVSALYLKRLCGNPADGEIQRILSGAAWAVQQYGFYRFVPTGEEEPEERGKQVPAAGAVVRENERPETVPEAEKPGPVCEQLRMDMGESGEGRNGTVSGDGAEDPGPVKEEEPPLREGSVPAAPDVKEKPKSAGDGFTQISMEIPEDDREEMRVGTVLKVKKRARYWSVTVDLGPLYGRGSVKWASGPEAEGMIGQQVVCGIRTGADGRQIRLVGIGQEGGMVAVEPAERVRNGERVE